MTKQKDAIRGFIISNLEEGSSNITTLTAEKFSISRQAVLKHINKLIEDNYILVEGKTRDRKYSFKPIVDSTMEFPLTGLEEDTIWRKYLLPLLDEVPSNIVKICYYGFTEMLNNAIDHSNGKKGTISVERTLREVQIVINDDGIGIFNKLQQELGLTDNLHAILELSKGKLTTDPKRHTGEGIFFSSRIFDAFSISSGKLYFSHFSKLNSIEESDWLLEDKNDSIQGTVIRMKIRLDSTRTTAAVFNYYSGADEFGFTKTQIPVFLAQHGAENLISRSQAKRLLTRFERFKEIILDFKDVDEIGQAFADEIFRVFKNEHPGINFYPINTNEQITKMIKRVQNAL
jgi:anti-sigma regulatory factor (Ser/Thr protein kinase)/virulence-associated protein VapD